MAWLRWIFVLLIIDGGMEQYTFEHILCEILHWVINGLYNNSKRLFLKLGFLRSGGIYSNINFGSPGIIWGWCGKGCARGKAKSTYFLHLRPQQSLFLLQLLWKFIPHALAESAAAYTHSRRFLKNMPSTWIKPSCAETTDWHFLARFLCTPPHFYARA